MSGAGGAWCRRENKVLGHGGLGLSHEIAVRERVREKREDKKMKERRRLEKKREKQETGRVNPTRSLVKPYPRVASSFNPISPSLKSYKPNPKTKPTQTQFLQNKPHFT